VGRTVVIENNGKIGEFTIVETIEADPSNGKISNESPLGRTLLGKGIGETVTVETPSLSNTYKIINIK
jgi:transcription elongation factor GreA